MKATTYIASGILALTIFIPTSAGAPAPAPEEPNIATPPAKEVMIKPYHAPAEPPPEAKDLRAILRAIATAKGLPEAKIEQIEGTIGGVPPYDNPTCPHGESGWYPNAVGDNGKSFGLVQIHLPSHPGVTASQAKDPVFALTFIVDAFASGKERMWTCWRALYG